MNRTKLLAVTTGALVAVASAAMPVLAADDGGVDATITIASTGALSISSPTGTVNLGSEGYDTADPAALGSWATDTDLTALTTALQGQADIVGAFGNVSVTDSRLGLVVSWSSTVSWTDFKLETTSTAADEIIAADQIRYNSGTPSTEGIGTFVPQIAAVQSGGTAATYTGILQVSGSNTVTWNPTFYVDLQGEKAGTYEGTVTHSVTAS